MKLEALPSTVTLDAHARRGLNEHLAFKRGVAGPKKMATGSNYFKMCKKLLSSQAGFLGSTES